MNSSRGFTVIEALLVILLLASAVAITISNIPVDDYVINENSSTHISVVTDIEMGLNNYLQRGDGFPEDSNADANLLDENSFVPRFVFPGKGPSLADKTYGVNGYVFSSNNDGWYVCFRHVDVTEGNHAGGVMAVMKNKLATGKFFFNTSCPATSDTTLTTTPATVYGTYWIMRTN